MQTRAVVSGAGGFIGWHLVRYLQEKGYWVRGVDIKLPSFEPTTADDFELLDLRISKNALRATRGVDEVYQLAASMGGMGFISDEQAQAVIIWDNTMINFLMLESARQNGVKRYFFSSSGCAYPDYRQTELDSEPLKESDVYPADPQKSYGWAKLHNEHLCKYYNACYAIRTRVARFQNCYGPMGAWVGGKEKAPAALSRKVATAKLKGEKAIPVWGDGKAEREYMYIDDCVRGIHAIMQSEHSEPFNLGGGNRISVDGLVDLIADIADYPVEKDHDLSKPQGVRGRSADLTRAKELLGWEPEWSLRDGMAVTYKWIEEQVARTL